MRRVLLPTVGRRPEAPWLYLPVSLLVSYLSCRKERKEQKRAEAPINRQGTSSRSITRFTVGRCFRRCRKEQKEQEHHTRRQGDGIPLPPVSLLVGVVAVTNILNFLDFLAEISGDSAGRRHLAASPVSLLVDVSVVQQSITFSTFCNFLLKHQARDGQSSVTHFLRNSFPLHERRRASSVPE